MALSQENLLKELDRDPGQIANFWATELKNEEAYAFLMKAVRGSDLNGNQMRNALHALFRILTVQDRGSLVDVLETYIALARHPTKEIRSEAVQLAIGLVRYINSTTVRYTNITIPVPITFSDKEEKALRDAMALGLTPKVADLAAKFFGHEV